VALEGLRGPPIQPLLARPRGIAISQFGVNLREQFLHLLGIGVGHPCAGAVRKAVGEFLGADGDEVMLFISMRKSLSINELRARGGGVSVTP